MAEIAAYERTRAWRVFRERLGDHPPSETLFQQLLKTLCPETRGDVHTLSDARIADAFAFEIERLSPQVLEELLWGSTVRMLEDRTSHRDEERS